MYVFHLISDFLQDKKKSEIKSEVKLEFPNNTIPQSILNLLIISYDIFRSSSNGPEFRSFRNAFFVSRGSIYELVIL